MRIMLTSTTIATLILLHTIQAQVTWPVRRTPRRIRMWTIRFRVIEMDECCEDDITDEDMEHLVVLDTEGWPRWFVRLLQWIGVLI